ncbi:MAG: DUF2892 domain-containing protein [Alphaproteobacteria bacterium]|nr:DUF2892 domain-containing protein [Alphaproteobacteria bacterium]
MIPSTTQRVPLHTRRGANEKIDRQTRRNIAYYAVNRSEIDARLEELEREWDIERTLEANAATVTVASVILGLLASRKWLFMPALVGGFLLQHAVQGWCPPLPLFRRLGVRTQSEIEREYYALKALRGDFDHLGETRESGAELSRRVLQAVD